MTFHRSSRIKANAAILAVICISIASHAQTAGENRNWRTPDGNFEVVELSFSGTMRDAWTLTYTPWFRWKLPMPLYALVGFCLLSFVVLAWLHAVLRYRRSWAWRE